MTDRDDPAGHWLVLTTRDALARQARDAMIAIADANGGVEPPTLRAAYDVDPIAFARLIEALVNLGANVADDLRQLAGLRPIGEILGDP